MNIANVGINLQELKINLVNLPKKKMTGNDFLQITGLNIVEEFKSSQLKNHPYFSEICKFVIFCYDKNGLVKYTDNAVDRKKQAIQMIFSDTADKDLEKNLLSGTDRDVLALAIGYLKYQDNMKFANLMSYEKIFWENIETLNETTTTTDEEKKIKSIALKSKIREENEVLQESIQELRKYIYPADELQDLALFNKVKSDYGTGNILERYARIKAESLADDN